MLSTFYEKECKVRTKLLIKTIHVKNPHFRKPFINSYVKKSTFCFRNKINILNKISL